MVRSVMAPGFSRPCGHFLRDRGDGVGDLGPSAVVDAHVQGARAVAPGVVLGLFEFADHRAPQLRAPPGPADPDPPFIELVPLPAQDVLVEAHQEAHFLRGPPPVLGGEGVHTHVFDPQLDRAGHDVQQGRLPCFVALDPRQAALVRPAPVAVHDDRHMPRDELRGNRGRNSAGRVRIRSHHRGGPPPTVGLFRLAFLQVLSQASSQCHFYVRSTCLRDFRTRSRCHCR